MNINDICHLIETEFKVIKKEKGIICVALISGEDYPETIVKLILNEAINHFELFEVVRGKEYKVNLYSDKYKSMIALYLFSKSKLEVRKHDMDRQTEIRNATSLNEIQKILRTFSDEQYYSFFKIKPNKIILEKNTNDRFNVLFLGQGDSKIYIAKSRSLNSAALVLYNFSHKLSQFYESLNKIELKNDPEFIENLKELYILG
ncbi:hypothetical protein JI666_20800 [Bacillus sp. NTK071]|uniref:hypothetical protein n=1 Tax=Bacillus sp. NTK071 TaxID=2802175 RepID=UPI001A903ED4|nr:hypothetical protein [Bacillus sp. NTK071]MBN8211162.1 hypothetical protein [Bacillus sp. NTK071]